MCRFVITLTLKNANLAYLRYYDSFQLCIHIFASSLHFDIAVFCFIKTCVENNTNSLKILA